MEKLIMLIPKLAQALLALEVVFTKVAQTMPIPLIEMA